MLCKWKCFLVSYLDYALLLCRTKVEPRVVWLGGSGIILQTEKSLV